MHLRPAPLETNPDLGAYLLRIARETIAEALDGLATSVTTPPADLDRLLSAPGASFVSLHARSEDGDALRGCIGSLEPRRPLVDDVRHNAVQAAYHDPRFPPLQRPELPSISIEVSVLTPAEPLPCKGEAEAVRTLRPDVDGVILRCGALRATFLPQVWSSLPRPYDFLAQLKLKAGLPAIGWRTDIELLRYRVVAWKDG